MRFSGASSPFQIPRIEVARLGNFYSLRAVTPLRPDPASRLGGRAAFRSVPRAAREAEIERSDPDGLSAAQFSNLHRWGNPYVMDEFRFHMPVTGPVNLVDMPRIEPALRTVFEPVLCEPSRSPTSR